MQYDKLVPAQLNYLFIWDFDDLLILALSQSLSFFLWFVQSIIAWTQSLNGALKWLGVLRLHIVSFVSNCLVGFDNISFDASVQLNLELLLWKCECVFHRIQLCFFLFQFKFILDHALVCMVKFDFSLITLVIDQILKNFEEETSAKHGPSIEECAEFFKLFGQFIQIILIEFVYLNEVFDLFFLFIPATSILRTICLKLKSWDKVEEHIEVAVPAALTQSHNSYSV